jgi:hypothetical protein
MSFETKCMSGVKTSFSDTEVIVHPHVHLSSANRAADAEKNPSGELDQLSADRSDAMRYEMGRTLHPYVLLNFLPCSEAAGRPLSLAVVFHLSSTPLIMIRYAWQTGLNDKDRESLIELMDDWTRASPERVLALFRQLECLSVGPIRATVSGIATAETLEHLMYAVLGNAGDFGGLTL